MIFDEAFMAGLTEQIEDVISDDNPVIAACQSPIEKRFASAFMLLVALLEGRPWHMRFADYPTSQLLIEPQHRIDPYRVDFLIAWRGAHYRDVGFVVECDGHAFHEKTKDQAARDKARDRFLSIHFAKVLRFTGSEIHNRPFECAHEAFGIADSLRANYAGEWQK